MHDNRAMLDAGAGAGGSFCEAGGGRVCDTSRQCDLPASSKTKVSALQIVMLVYEDTVNNADTNNGNDNDSNTTNDGHVPMQCHRKTFIPCRKCQSLL